MDDLERNRIAFRLRNPAPEFAAAIARGRARWQERRGAKFARDARATFRAANGLPEPDNILLDGPWLVENQAWFARLTTRSAPITPYHTSWADRPTPHPRGVA